MNVSRLRELGVGKRRLGDPLFTDGDAECRMFVREGILDLDDELLYHQVVVTFPCDVPNCEETFSSLLEFEMHYNSRHRFRCSQCRKQLPSAHFLDLHLSETHDSFFAAQAERKPMFRCFVEECPIVSQDILQRRSHCIEAHSFPHDFRYDSSHKKSKEKAQVKPTSSTETAATVDVLQASKDIKHFTFGKGKQGKTFSSKPWHTKGKTNHKKTTTEISTAELMDTLPPP